MHSRPEHSSPAAGHSGVPEPDVSAPDAGTMPPGQMSGGCSVHTHATRARSQRDVMLALSAAAAVALAARKRSRGRRLNLRSRARGCWGRSAPTRSIAAAMLLRSRGYHGRSCSLEAEILRRLRHRGALSCALAQCAPAKDPGCLGNTSLHAFRPACRAVRFACSNNGRARAFRLTDPSRPRGLDALALGWRLGAAERPRHCGDRRRIASARAQRNDRSARRAQSQHAHPSPRALWRNAHRPEPQRRRRSLESGLSDHGDRSARRGALHVHRDARRGRQRRRDRAVFSTCLRAETVACTSSRATKCARATQAFAFVPSCTTTATSRG